MENSENSFDVGGVYKHRLIDDSVFICVPHYSDKIGKIVQYKKEGDRYNKTFNTYFLNCYITEDLKEVFVCRENYEMLGYINKSYKLSEDREYIYEIRT